MQITSSFERDRRIFGDLTAADARALAGAFETKVFPKTDFLTRQGEPDAMEYILLSGKVVSLIGDADGREVCVGFYVGPCVIAPNLARAADGKSLVNLRMEFGRAGCFGIDGDPSETDARFLSNRGVGQCCATRRT